MLVGIINYGLGNVAAFKYAFQKLNSNVREINKLEDFKKVSHLILPGVGSFDYAINLLKKSEFLSVITDEVLNKKKPILGVCVGMQLLFDKSEEGELKGLGWIKGEVKKLKFDCLGKKSLPHMGWNKIKSIDYNQNFCKNLNAEEFYFLHSYHCVPQNKNDICSTTFYGQEFCSAIQSQNICGCQFHPEKSHDAGLKVFSNFLKINWC